jgi:hypothetical protein
VEGVEVRIDLSQEYPDVRRYVELLIQLAKKYEWVFVSVGGKILMPDYNLLAIELKLSDAQDFVNAPREHINRKLSRGSREE